jgi:hypothetical protein
MKRPGLQYSMFVRINGKWHRITPLHGELSEARRIFRNVLLSLSIRGVNVELRLCKGWGKETKQYYKDVWSLLRGETPSV